HRRPGHAASAACSVAAHTSDPLLSCLSVKANLPRSNRPASILMTVGSNLPVPCRGREGLASPRPRRCRASWRAGVVFAPTARHHACYLWVVYEEIGMGVDRFGNRFAPNLSYARGHILPTTAH